MTVGTFDGDPGEWDAFVRRREGWTHFHLYGWKRIVEEVHGHECPYLVARSNDGRLEGVLPLVRVRSPVFGRFLVSMPFVNYGGPLGSEKAEAALVRAAVELGRADGTELVELRSRKPISTELPASHRKITVLLDLPEGDPEILWEDLRSKVRSQVRRPRKEGVDARLGPDQLDGFYRVYAEHMRDLGTPAQPRSLFEAIRDVFPDDAWFACACLDGTPVAGGCGLEWGDEVEMTWASDLMEYRKIAPNMLLYWSFMERAVEKGLGVFNFGRCTPESGTHRFKQQWGTRDERLWWYQHSEEGVEATPSPDDQKWSWGPRLWRKLPVPVATAVGPKIVRYIP